MIEYEFCIFRVKTNHRFRRDRMRRPKPKDRKNNETGLQPVSKPVEQYLRFFSTVLGLADAKEHRHTKSQDHLATLKSVRLKRDLH